MVTRKERSLTQEKLAELRGSSCRPMRTLETKRVDTSAAILYRVCQVPKSP